MTAEEIFPFIYAIPGMYVNSFLIAEEGGLTLVDSGLKGGAKKILKAVAEIGRKPQDVRTILITHHHADHVGSLAALIGASGATACAHALDAPIVTGEQPRPPANRASILGRMIGPVIERVPANKPPVAPIGHLVEDGDTVACGMTAIHTPGHTLGHMSYLLPGHGGMLFAGDAAGHMMGRLGGSPGMFTEDMTLAKSSIRKLAELEFDVACFGHGSVLKGKANAAFRRYVENAAR